VIRFIEELALNAWPTLQTAHYDGWMLRFAEGYTRRANAVYPLYPSTLDVEEKIAHCERVYREKGQSAAFKIMAVAQPAGLDEALEGQGYRRDAPTSVQALDLEKIEAPHLDTATLAPSLNEQWMEAFCRLNAVEPRHVPTFTRMLNNLIPARCFITLQYEGKTAAAGLAVAERGHIGLFSIVTEEDMRNRGLGTEVVLHLLNWGKSQGAAHTYLQVMANNAPALHLYGKLGFREVYTYWYRVKAD
jgi:ribosomal protein S18 acetylase RimI-like enzyme